MGSRNTGPVPIFVDWQANLHVYKTVSIAMEVIFISLEQTAQLVFRMGTVLFISLFGVELMMQLGVMKYLRPIGEPVARLANLPSESALTFLTAIGSQIAAHTMIA